MIIIRSIFVVFHGVVLGHRFTSIRQAAMAKHHQLITERGKVNHDESEIDTMPEFDSLTFRLQKSYRLHKILEKTRSLGTKALLIDAYKRYFAKFSWKQQWIEMQHFLQHGHAILPNSYYRFMEIVKKCPDTVS